MPAVASAALWMLCAASAYGQALPADAEAPLFRIERQPVAGGGELLTVIGRIDGGTGPAGEADRVPLVSVLRDTLADDAPENDRLRYVWVHGYTSPSTSQRLASAVPFLNQRTGNKMPSGSYLSVPPSVIDLGAPGPDRGEGGKYLVLPPGYDGNVPEGGYFVARARTNFVIWFARAFMEDNDPKPVVDRIKKTLKV